MMSKTWQIVALAVGMAVPVAVASTWLLLSTLPFQTLLRIITVFGFCAVMAATVSTLSKDDAIPWSMFAGLVYGLVLLVTPVGVIGVVALFAPHALLRLVELTHSPMPGGWFSFSYFMIVPIVTTVALVTLVILTVMSLWAGAVAAAWTRRCPSRTQ